MDPYSSNDPFGMFDDKLFEAFQNFASTLSTHVPDATDRVRDQVFRNANGQGCVVVNPELLRPENDGLFLRSYPQMVVEGYLNLDESHGWRSSGPPELGLAFTRHLARSFLQNRKEMQDKNVPMLERVLKTFLDTTPKQSRSAFDTSVSGWSNHAVSRLVGNLASNYRHSAPFFEVLINSASINGAGTCYPFSVRVFANGQELESRRQALAQLKPLPVDEARRIFYRNDISAPVEFLKRHSDQIGPNSTRILRALDNLSGRILHAQSVGNCWIKQPMRVLLVALYLEIVSEYKEMPFEDAWKNATLFYKQMQRGVTPLIEQLIQQSKVDEAAKGVAKRELARREG